MQVYRIDKKIITDDIMHKVNNTTITPIMDAIYPVGSIYMSVNATNPSTFFGGTWERIAKGRTLVGVDEKDSDFNKPGLLFGEKTHTLTIDEMPRHNHMLKWSNEGAAGSGYGTLLRPFSMTTLYSYESGDTGENKPHNNVQPSFTVYIFKRTS